MNDQQRQDDPSTMAARKFLKQLGVTTHQQIEEALADAVAGGKMTAGESIEITARVEIAALGISHDVKANLIAPQK